MKHITFSWFKVGLEEMVVVIINTNHTVGIFSQEDEYMHIK